MRKNAAIGNARWLTEPKWHAQFKPFGHRLDFLSPENRQLNTGKIRILPPRGDRKRIRDEPAD